MDESAKCECMCVTIGELKLDVFVVCLGMKHCLHLFARVFHVFRKVSQYCAMSVAMMFHMLFVNGR